MSVLLTSNQLITPGKLLLVVNVVRSIHIDCRNTHTNNKLCYMCYMHATIA